MGVGADLYMYNVVVKKFTLAISSPDEFLDIISILLLTGNGSYRTQICIQVFPELQSRHVDLETMKWEIVRKCNISAVMWGRPYQECL